MGGVYSCSCPAWRNQSLGIEQRSCKHLRRYRGDAAEAERVGQPAPRAPARRSGANGGSAAAVASDGHVEPTAPPVLLAERWDGVQDPSGWWLSEKLDGVRAYWDGEVFLSRLGNRYVCPAWFSEGLPKTPLDGELWVGRKKFQKTVSIVRRQDQSEHWREVRYLVFDAPALDAPFEQRLAALEAAVADAPYASAHPHQRCAGIEQLQGELARVEALGGEGLMLRKPGSRYVAGRSSTLLKVKTFHDAEARVIDHLPGTGRHKGRLGALRAELPDGTRFSVGTGLSDAERDNPPPVGTLITFRYQELSDDGVPRFPSYVGVRHDVAWPAEAKTPAPAAAAKPAPASKPAPAAKTPAPAAKPAPAAPKAAPAKPAPAPATAASTTNTNDVTYLEFVGGSSSKFWEVTIKGVELYVRYGRIGAQGTTQLKTFADETAARREAGKLADGKRKKGYREPS